MRRNQQASSSDCVRSDFENGLTGVNAITELAAPASSVVLNTAAEQLGEGTALTLPVKVTWKTRCSAANAISARLGTDRVEPHDRGNGGWPDG